jgi:hypothetical protein
MVKYNFEGKSYEITITDEWEGWLKHIGEMGRIESPKNETKFW